MRSPSITKDDEIMGNLFHGWRRKVGVATLAMALAFMGWWVRSFVVQDDIDFPDFVNTPGGDQPISGLATDKHALILLTYDGNVVYETATVLTLTHSNVPSSDVSLSEDETSSDLQNDQPTVECQAHVEVCQVPLIEIPFSSIVIPLTLISSWLLLTKPQSAKQKNSETYGMAA